MNLSIVIPAHNEEDFLEDCLGAIEHGANMFYPDIDIEIVVVLNRCTDKTQSIACEGNATLIYEDAKNLAVIRNAGIQGALYDNIVTIDADTWLDPQALGEIAQGFEDESLVGGTIPCRLERVTPAIQETCKRIANYLPPGIPFGGGGFWFRRKDFEAFGGFNEAYCTTEDVEFARDLRYHGAKTGRSYSTMLGGGVTSSRKFDEFGDTLSPVTIARIFRGTDQKTANEFYYDLRS